MPPCSSIGCQDPASSYNSSLTSSNSKHKPAARGTSWSIIVEGRLGSCTKSSACLLSSFLLAELCTQFDRTDCVGSEIRGRQANPAPKEYRWRGPENSHVFPNARCTFRVLAERIASNPCHTASYRSFDRHHDDAARKRLLRPSRNGAKLPKQRAPYSRDVEDVAISHARESDLGDAAA